MSVPLTTETRPLRHELFFYSSLFLSSSKWFCTWSYLILVIYNSQKYYKCNVLFCFCFPSILVSPLHHLFGGKNWTWSINCCGNVNFYCERQVVLFLLQFSFSHCLSQLLNALNQIICLHFKISVLRMLG